MDLIGSEEFAHLERISPEMYGSDSTMDGLRQVEVEVVR